MQLLVRPASCVLILHQLIMPVVLLAPGRAPPPPVAVHHLSSPLSPQSDNLSSCFPSETVTSSCWGILYFDYFRYCFKKTICECSLDQHSWRLHSITRRFSFPATPPPLLHCSPCFLARGRPPCLALPAGHHRLLLPSQVLVI